VKPAIAPRTRPPRFRSLATRLVALGILQMLLVATGAVVIFVVEGPHTAARPSEHLDRETRHHLESLVDSPAELATALDELERKRIDISLYDASRQLVASNVEPPLAFPHRRPWHDEDLPPEPPDGDHPALAPGGPPPPPGGEHAPAPPPLPGDRSRDDADRANLPHVMVTPLAVHGARGFLIARGRPGEPPGLTGPLLALISGFFVLGFGALLTARWIVRPIEQLSKTARALGDGDLGARSRLARSDEIGELGGRFDEMAERIEGLLRSEKELLANVAHELRTPLTRIGVALDIAGEGDAEAARASLGEIAVDVSELETIVDDVLTALRFEIATTKAAALPLRRTRSLPDAIARAAADRLHSRHPERPLDVRVDPELAAIDVDPVLFRRVIDNLLENAHKYTPDTSLPIVLAVTGLGDRIAFEVRDQGIGISAEDLPLVFTAFFRGDRSRSRETGGVGLGLTLARRIVEAHGGTIAATSTRGSGSTLRVTVPADT